MCGIVGIINIDGKPEINRSLLNDMNQAQVHRGPDEGNLYVEAGVGLGHRRLSIIDLSTGQQPLANEDGSVIVTYNGEIYNFNELREQLLTHGHQFKTHSDTEVIVHAWEQWGEACVTHFRGMFAFCVWDRNQQTAFIARDRLGIKPIYYAELTNQQFIFASELKALKIHPQLNKELDPCAIEEYFTLGYIPEPRSIYKQVKKLEPGHSLLISLKDKGDIKLKQYWDLEFDESIKGTEQEISEQLIEQLKEATKIRMVSEVPIGAFLSGGVDSSAIVAMMANLSDKPVNTCAIGFDHQAYDESKYARQVAKQYKTQHFQEQVNSNDFQLIDQLIDFYDEPYADSSALPTYQVCKLARKNVTVALSGDGGDENLAGYRRQRLHMNEEKVRGMLPYSARKPIFGTLGAIYPKMDWAPQFLRAKTTFQALGRHSAEAYMHSVAISSIEERQQLFSSKLKQQLQGYQAVEVFKQHAKNCTSDSPLSLIQYLDFKTYLTGDILTKVDRASMANSLEVRVPILDHKLVEWIAKLSPTLKLKGSEGKYIFKKSLEPYLSDDILYRKKMGFSVPLSSWFRNELREDIRKIVLSDEMLETGLFEQRTLKTMLDQHQSGKKELSPQLWSLMMFSKFLQKN